MVLPGSGPAADAARRFFGARRSRPGAAGSEVEELVLQPAAGCGSAHVTVTIVSTERFGQDVKGLRATHRPSAQDLRVRVGLGGIVALYCRSSTLYQIR